MSHRTRAFMVDSHTPSTHWRYGSRILKVIGLALFLLDGFQLSLSANNTGASFLELGDGSRALALGGAYTAVPGDVDSLYYNPAGLAFMRNPEVTFTHSEWLEDTNFDVLSYGQPTRWGTFGLSAMHVGAGTLEGRDANRQLTGDFTADDIAGLLSYSHTIGTSAGLGVTAKYLRSHIANDNAATVAFDAGAQAKVPGMSLWFGAAALNMGSGMRFENQMDDLPLSLDIGSAYGLTRSMLVSADFVRQPNDRISNLRLGAEYRISLFEFRAGYDQLLQGQGDKSLNASQNIRGGIGFHWARYHIDYALAPFGDLGLTQRFTVGVAFGPVDQTEEGPHNLRTP